MPLALAGASLILAGPVPADTANPPASAPGFCLAADKAAALLQRESALLGPEHAARHARARQESCVARTAKIVRPAARLAAAAAAPASQVGSWSTPIHVPVVGVTAVLLHTGRVLFWSYDPASYQDPYNSNTGVAYLWDPVSRSGRSIKPPENIWCGGQTLLADGRVFVAGGNLRYPDPNAPNGNTGWVGALSMYTFDPATENWVRQPDMSDGRWYPTATQLADNSVIITSGYDASGYEMINQAVERFRPDPYGGVGTLQTLQPHDPSGFYPFQYLLPSGQMLQAGPAMENVYLLDADNDNWSRGGDMWASHYGFANGIIYTDASGTSLQQAVMIAGGADSPIAIKANEWMDGLHPEHGWLSFPQWLQGRQNSNTVILPDGTLFTVGGNQTNSYDLPLFQSELYNRQATDTGGQWLEMAPNTIQAAYHSTALLLPDATVLLSQDDMDSTVAGAAAHQVQVYSPPYLFRGARPTIKAYPTSVQLGRSYMVYTASANPIASVSLVAPGAVTHGNDMHQRVVKLKWRPYGSRAIITVPSSHNIVPPGYYMLFVIDSKGVPSVARFVRVA